MYSRLDSRDRLQNFLAHQKTPTSLGPPSKTLGVVLLQGPKGVRFLISKVPLYHASREGTSHLLSNLPERTLKVASSSHFAAGGGVLGIPGSIRVPEVRPMGGGYLAHKKTPNPLGSP